MAIKTISTNGDHVVSAVGASGHTRSVVVIEENSAATLTWGYKKANGDFQAWPTPSIDISEGFAMNHGADVVIMVRVASIGDPVVINVRP